jgi:hypothetical protein
MPLLGSRGAASLTGFGGLAKLGYLLRNSLRFRASNSAYLSRTPAGAGNQQTWTWSGWVKRGVLGSASTLVSGGGTTGRLALFFNGSDQLEIDVGGTGSFQNSTAVFRDPAAWYHVVWAFDTTQGTGANRSRIYVNGTELSLTQTRTFTQNTDYAINGTGIQTHGTLSNSIGGYDFDGYMAEVNFVNGQALTPSSFGKTDAVTGQWIPIKYSGTYGTNGYYLPFTNTTSTSTLGNDFSGNGNTWTVNNFSLTTGATYDSMTDVPTLTSATAANYATLNPLVPVTNTTRSNGNLTFTKTGNSDIVLPSTIAMPSGKFYWETTLTSVSSGSNIGLGLIQQDAPSAGTGTWPGADNPAIVLFAGNGNLYVNGTTSSGTGVSLATNDVVGLALDMSAATLALYKNGSLVYTATSLVVTKPYLALFNSYGNGESQAVNFGQRPFAYTPPSGFKNLNTFNLP